MPLRSDHSFAPVETMNSLSKMAPRKQIWLLSIRGRPSDGAAAHAQRAQHISFFSYLKSHGRLSLRQLPIVEGSGDAMTTRTLLFRGFLRHGGIPSQTINQSRHGQTCILKSAVPQIGQIRQHSRRPTSSAIPESPSYQDTVRSDPQSFCERPRPQILPIPRTSPPCLACGAIRYDRARRAIRPCRRFRSGTYMACSNPFGACTTTSRRADAASKERFFIVRLSGVSPKCLGLPGSCFWAATGNSEEAVRGIRSGIRQSPSKADPTAARS